MPATPDDPEIVEWPFSAGPVKYHTVRFVYPMEAMGGDERREVDGSTDEFGWFGPEDVAGLAMGDLVELFVAADAAAKSGT